MREKGIVFVREPNQADYGIVAVFLDLYAIAGIHLSLAGMTQTGHPISRASMVVAALSTVVEWYDFTLYLYFATVLSRVLFGPAQRARY